MTRKSTSPTSNDCRKLVLPHIARRFKRVSQKARQPKRRPYNSSYNRFREDNIMMYTVITLHGSTRSYGQKS